MLDFDGYSTTTSIGTHWNNTQNGGNPVTTPAFSMDSDRTTFSAIERQSMINAWRIVAEDYVPFDVDVTTEEPATGDEAFRKTNAADLEYGVRVICGPQTWSSFISGLFGIAPGFTHFGHTVDFQVFNFSDDIGGFSTGYEGDSGDTVSHEVGHTLGLFHHGDTSNPYYGGHGSGATKWGPIMGSAFFTSLQQWSHGTYPGANNSGQDDLATIATTIPYNPDDYPNAIAGPNLTSLNQPKFNQLAKTYGVIERNTDSGCLLDFRGCWKHQYLGCP